ncbi:MAG TPA: TonB-dependent receptor [Pseudomonadales bacterium]|nr:TonB-dependent receptor [Pseudomonadales bacterium]
MKRIAFAILLCTFFQVRAAQAEDTDLFDLSLNDLAAVKVSVATFFPVSLAESPASVNLVTAEQWHEQGARSVAEAVSGLPGVWVTPANYGGQAVNMRGFFPGYHGVSTLLDGVTVNSFFYSDAFEDYRLWQLGNLSQIEVIRGPGSSQYGADALRGVIAMHSWTEADSKMPGGQLQTRYADSGARSVEYRDQTSTDAGNLRFSMQWQAQPDQAVPYRYTVPTTQEEKQSQYSNELSDHMLAAGWSKALDKNKIEVAFYNSRNYSNQTPGLGTQLSNGISVNEDRDFSGHDIHFSMLRSSFSHRVSDRLESKCTLSFWERSGYVLLDRTRDPTTLAYAKYRVDETKKFAQCLSHISNGTQADTTLGLEFSRQALEKLRFSEFQSDGDFVDSGVFSAEGFARNTASAYFQSTLALKSTTLSAGGRYDHFSDFDSHFSPRLAVTQALNNNHFIKFNASNALLSPTPFQIFGTGSPVQPSPNLKAEEMNNYELGWSYIRSNELMGVTLFSSHWFDGIVLERINNNGGPFLVQYQNRERSQSQGVELEWQKQWKNIKTQISFTHSNAKNQRLGIEYTGFPNNILSWSVERQYSDKIKFGLRNLIAKQYSIRYAVENDPHPPAAPTYIRFDLHAAYSPDNLVELFTDVRNLANRKNVLAGVYNQEQGLNDEDALVMLGVDVKW